MQTELLKVSGMSCGRCVGKVTHALQAVDSVKDINVSLAVGEVTVQFDEQRASTDQMKTAVERAGYAVGEAPRRSAAAVVAADDPWRSVG